jgi:hypothetical protein
MIEEVGDACLDISLLIDGKHLSIEVVRRTNETHILYGFYMGGTPDE